ncbi:MAG: phosphoribosyltransferase family protein [Bdellovibrionota bacterium]
MSNSGVVTYRGEKSFDLELCGLKRTLPVVRISDSAWIASFVMLGDVELIERAADTIASMLAPGFDVIVVPEAKAIPLAHAVARRTGRSYRVIRKSSKAYFSGEISMPVDSITTRSAQRLYLDGSDARMLAGAKVCLVDDVVSTGSTLSASAALLTKAGAHIHQIATVLIEGDAAPDAFAKYAPNPLVHLATIPLFVTSG